MDEGARQDLAENSPDEDLFDAEIPATPIRRPDSQAAVEALARNVLGLAGLNAAPPALPPRAEQLWRQDGFAADVPFTNAMFVPMGQAADIGLLHESVAAIVGRHEALRTRLAVRRGRAIQIAEDWKAGHLEVTDVLQSEIADLRPGQKSAVGTFTQGGMDLYAQDGFRCHVFRDENENVTLGFLAHGFFADARSSHILVREIRAAYEALGSGAPAPFEPAVSYAEYALAQRRSLDRNLSSHLTFWHGLIDNMPPSRLPYDRDEDTGRRGRSFFFVDLRMMARLEALAQQSRVSLTVLLLAAYQLSLAKWSGQREILSAAYTADRVDPRFHNTIGFLVANMPVCARIASEGSFKAFLLDLAKRYYGGFAHRELSCELYEAIYAPQKPFCATVFNFIPAQKNSSGGDLHSIPSFEGVMTAPDAAKPAIYREVYLGLSQHSNGMLGKVFYNAGRFSPAGIETFIRHFRSVLQKIVSDPDMKTDRLLD